MQKNYAVNSGTVNFESTNEGAALTFKLKPEVVAAPVTETKVEETSDN